MSTGKKENVQQAVELTISFFMVLPRGVEPNTKMADIAVRILTTQVADLLNFQTSREDRVLAAMALQGLTAAVHKLRVGEAVAVDEASKPDLEALPKVTKADILELAAFIGINAGAPRATMQ